MESYYKYVGSHPALKMIGGNKYMKNNSSLKTKSGEFCPLLTNSTTAPEANPYYEANIFQIVCTRCRKSQNLLKSITI